SCVPMAPSKTSGPDARASRNGGSDATLRSTPPSPARKQPAATRAHTIRRDVACSVVRVPVGRRQDLPARVVRLGLHAQHPQRPQARGLAVLFFLDDEAVQLEAVAALLAELLHLFAP